MSQVNKRGQAKGTNSVGMKSFKNASVSAIDAGGSLGVSCTGDVCVPATLPWRCASTLDPGSNAAPPSSVEGVRGLDISMGD